MVSQVVQKDELATEAEAEERLEATDIDPADEVEPGRTSTFAALTYRNFRLFWFGLIVSNTGTWMQMYGQGVLVVSLAVGAGTPELAPLYLGLVGLARAIPGIGLGLFAGAVIDRVDRRKLLLVTQISGGLCAAFLATITLTGHANVVWIIAIAGVSSMFLAFDAPTRQAVVPRLVDERHLMSAIGLNSVAFNGAQMIGPLIGGLLILPLGVGGLFIVNALSYAAVVGAILAMGSFPARTAARKTSMLVAIGEGFNFIRHEPVIRWVVFTTFVCAFFSRPYPQLMPAFAEGALHVGPIELSLLMGASGAGALIGAMTTASLGSVRRRGLVLLGSGLVVGVFLIAFALQRTMIATVPLLVVTSAASMLFMGMVTTFLQTRAPDHMVGRVMSVQAIIMMGFIPLGTLALGVVGTFVGVENALVLGGVLMTASTLLATVKGTALRDDVAGSDTSRMRSQAG